MRAEWLCVVAVVGCVAPSDPEHDGKVPGTLLGSYAVTARIAEDECNADLLGAPDPWMFPLKLSRFQDDLYWLNGREAIVGELDEKAETFAFSTRVDVEVTPPTGASFGCTVSRYDRAAGKLDFEAEAVVALEGELEFEYRAKPGAECFEIVGVPGGFVTLPCVLRYRMVGDITEAAP
jgi:hypothetical protein